MSVLADSAGEGFFVPNGVTSLANVLGVKIWLSSGALTERARLVEGEALRTGDAVFFFLGPNVRGSAFHACASSIGLELALTLALLRNWVPCLVFLAN